MNAPVRLCLLSRPCSIPSLRSGPSPLVSQLAKGLLPGGNPQLKVHIPQPVGEPVTTGPVLGLCQRCPGAPRAPEVLFSIRRTDGLPSPDGLPTALSFVGSPVGLTA